MLYKLVLGPTYRSKFATIPFDSRQKLKSPFLFLAAPPELVARATNALDRFHSDLNSLLSNMEATDRHIAQNIEPRALNIAMLESWLGFTKLSYSRMMSTYETIKATYPDIYVEREEYEDIEWATYIAKVEGDLETLKQVE